MDAAWRAKKLRQLDDLADELAPILATESIRSPMSEQESAPNEMAPRLDLDALDDAPEAGTSGPSRSRVR